MRRSLTIAAFVVVVALVSASAQRGGMRVPGGGRSLGVEHPSGGHAFSGMHAPPSGRPFFRGDGFGGVHIRTRGFRHCHGCRALFWSPWWFAGFGYGAYYPYWWDSSSSYNYDEGRTRELALANEMNALSIQEQNLREREDSLREREEQDSYARRPQAREEEHAAPSPATVLVFRDQHRQEVTSYAISGGTLWVLSDHLATRKIPLTELDLAATAKANDERGVEFQVPK